ncbi:aldose epimerase family protein [Gemmatimonadota bacterium]
MDKAMTPRAHLSPALMGAALATLLLLATACGGPSPGDIETEPFGVNLYTLENANGMRARITNYGATLVSLEVPDASGRTANVVLGFSDLDGYLGDHPYFGATVGRFANRIGEGRFTIEGQTYQLARNNGSNHLHGGINGYHRVVWKAEPFLHDEGEALRLTYHSPDMEEGYPGNLDITLLYILTADGLKVDFTATTDALTPVNLTHHSYFNLAGAGSGDVLDHEIEIFADHFLPVDDGLIPTGEIRPVDGTALDLRSPRRIGEGIMGIVGEHFAGGYDHCLVLSGRAETGVTRLAARVRDPGSGRVLEVWTDQPGLQFYSGNFLDGTIVGAEGAPYVKHAAFCLEPQLYPDSPNKPDFPSPYLGPGQTYRHTTVYRFPIEP